MDWRPEQTSQPHVYQTRELDTVIRSRPSEMRWGGGVFGGA